MDNSNYKEELLVQYLLNELDESKQAGVLAWINANEQNSQYFEELKKTWRLTQINNVFTQVDVDYEWKQLDQKISFIKRREEQQRAGNEEISTPGRKRTLYKIIVSTAIAASVLLAIALGFGIFDVEKNVPSVAVSEVQVDSSLAHTFIRSEKNFSGKLRYVKLPDGSKVTLYNKSEIRFEEPFATDKRDIILMGKATFTVQKDKTRPFTVFSGNLSTTALGTKFTVTAFEKEQFIVVRLFEGKVVVKPRYDQPKLLANNFYLFPGQELIYDNQKVLATVRKFGSNSLAAAKTSKKEKAAVDSVSIPESETGSWFMFHNQPLNLVFEELENMFDVDIEYSKKEMSTIYFIGKFDRADSFESIIMQIAKINNLKVSKKENKFILKK